MKSEEALETIFDTILFSGDNVPPAGFRPDDVFRPDEKEFSARVRNCLGACLLSLAGRPEGSRYLSKAAGGKKEESLLARFLLSSMETVKSECARASEGESNFRRRLESLAAFCAESKGKSVADIQRRVRDFFFPEGSIDSSAPQEDIRSLRKKRHVTIKSAAESQVTRPGREIIFTSNVLLTLPPEGVSYEELQLPYHIREHLQKTAGEEQLYWYDHPVQMGTAPEHNEILYGLKNLNDTVAFEKNRGTVASDTKVVCILSLSVTHTGLQRIARDYLDHELREGEPLEHLAIYVFTEEDCRSLTSRVILPAAKIAGIRAEEDVIAAIFGVDGEYGRHYSFLKAVTALWQVTVDPAVRATFKIDLDQVFPQDRLVEETGKSAFEHLSTPLWGAEGIDEKNRPLYLGMVAGALVNEGDIHHGLFTPDVTFKKEKLGGESLFFYSALPQALSTEAEMMTRYGTGSEPDGVSSCIHRIHVTGGTNGILIGALRRYRPFTPSFIGRAEDQAYLLSVLFNDEGRGFLRYAHESGLFMRHDKEAFAGEAIEAARIGKLVGDYIRILLFSFYAAELDCSLEECKDVVDPFTGCFISRIPFTIVLLRLVMKSLEFFLEGKGDDACELALQGAERCGDLMEKLQKEENFLRRRLARERRGWTFYYDILDSLEEGLRDRRVEALTIEEAAGEIIGECRIQ